MCLIKFICIIMPTWATSLRIYYLHFHRLTHRYNSDILSVRLKPFFSLKSNKNFSILTYSDSIYLDVQFVFPFKHVYVFRYCLPVDLVSTICRLRRTIRLSVQARICFQVLLTCWLLELFSLSKRDVSTKISLFWRIAISFIYQPFVDFLEFFPKSMLLSKTYTTGVLHKFFGILGIITWCHGEYSCSSVVSFLYSCKKRFFDCWTEFIISSTTLLVFLHGTFFRLLNGFRCWFIIHSTKNKIKNIYM